MVVATSSVVLAVDVVVVASSAVVCCSAVTGLEEMAAKQSETHKINIRKLGKQAQQLSVTILCLKRK